MLRVGSLLALLAAGLAHAQPPCTTGDEALPEGPVALGLEDADLGTGRRVCPRTEAGLALRLGASIDTADFYGTISANGVLFGAWAVRPDTELFASFEAASFTFAQNAVLTATQLTLGHLTGGVSRVLVIEDRFAVGVTARLLLPTSLQVPGAHLAGGELLTVVTWRPHPQVEVHGAAGGELVGALGQAASLTRGGGTLVTGLQYTPFSWGAVALDLNGHLGAVTWLAPALALRFQVGHLGFEVAATRPVLGTDRHDVIAGLRASWRFD